MNFIGIGALFLGIIGIVLSSIGVYFMWIDNGKNSIQPIIWATAGGVVMLLTVLLMVLATIFKGKNMRESETKVRKRIEIVKKKVNEEQEQFQSDVEESRQALVQAQLAEQEKLKRQIAERAQEREEERQKQKEVTFIPNPNFQQRGPEKVKAPVEKKIKELSRSMEELGRKLERPVAQDQRARVQEEGRREFERERLDLLKEQQREQQMAKTKAKEKNAQQMDALRKEMEMKERKLKEKIKKVSAQSSGQYNPYNPSINPMNGGMSMNPNGGGINPMQQLLLDQLKMMGKPEYQQQMMEGNVQMAGVLRDVINVATQAGAQAGSQAGAQVAEQTTIRTLNQSIQAGSQPVQPDIGTKNEPNVIPLTNFMPPLPPSNPMPLPPSNPMPLPPSNPMPQPPSNPPSMNPFLPLNLQPMNPPPSVSSISIPPVPVPQPSINSASIGVPSGPLGSLGSVYEEPRFSIPSDTSVRFPSQLPQPPFIEPLQLKPVSAPAQLEHYREPSVRTNVREPPRSFLPQSNKGVMASMQQFPQGNVYGQGITIPEAEMVSEKKLYSPANRVSGQMKNLGQQQNETQNQQQGYQKNEESEEEKPGEPKRTERRFAGEVKEGGNQNLFRQFSMMERKNRGEEV